MCVLALALGYAIGVRNFLHHYEDSLLDQCRIMVAQTDIKVLQYIIERENLSHAFHEYPCEAQRMLSSTLVNLLSCSSSQTCVSNISEWLPKDLNFALDNPLEVSRSLNQDCLKQR